MINAALHRKVLAALMTAGVLAAATAPLTAQAGEVYNRVDRQQGRIAQGVRSGQLTRGEYDSVEGHLDAINAQRRHDLRANGGYLTPGEKTQLNRELNRNSNRIYFDKHNLRRQPGA
jgi:hypothetical protein